MNWYVGQQVYCLRNGDGVIMDTKNDAPYPIRVKFLKRIETYTADGKFYISDATPMLYPEKPEITVPKWQPKEGEWCWFWGGFNQNAVRLSKFSCMKTTRYLDKTMNSWQNCAPFNGELPPHLKEVEK